MPDLAFTHNSLPGDRPSLLQTCRRQHQRWQTIIAKHEQEIDQLLVQLKKRLGIYATSTINENLHNLISELNRIQTELNPTL